MSIVIRPGDPKVNRICGIPNSVGRDLWLAGYFTSDRGYFFGSADADCPLKTYTLIANAKHPGQLPAPDDPNLRQIVKEAIAIVNSIQYKICPPGGHQ